MFFMGDSKPGDGFEASIHPTKTVFFFVGDSKPCKGFEASIHPIKNPFRGIHSVQSEEFL